MENITAQIDEKKKRLEELRSNKSDANCVGTNSSPADVLRETEIEDLEEEIQELEARL
jgi:hypothetical protein